MGGLNGGPSFDELFRLLIVLSNSDSLKSWLTLLKVLFVINGERIWLFVGLKAIIFISEASSPEYRANLLNTEYSSLTLAYALNLSNSSTAKRLF